jgi:hypothetical protein
MNRASLVLLVACAALAGCDSPEAARNRGGGLGADIGNRAPEVKMHEGSDQYWETPDRIGVEHPSLDPARQARQRSLQ